MRVRRLFIALCVSGFAAGASADDGYEFGLRLGLSVPNFDTTFSNPGAGAFSLPSGPVVATGGGFRVNANGGGAVSLAAGYRVGRAFVEGRYDRASFSFDNSFEPFRFTGPLTDTLNLEAKFVGDLPVVDYGRANLWSLDGGYRFGNRMEVEVAGGVTRLAGLRFRIDQRVLIPNFNLSSALVVPLAAQAPAGGAFGWNGGVALSFRVAQNASIGVEGRVFHFAKRTFSWGGTPFTPLRLGPEVIQRLNTGPEPVTLDPSLRQYSLRLKVRL